MTMSKSYLMKLARAERHLKEYVGLAQLLTQNHPWELVESWEADAWIYTVSIPEVPSDWSGLVVMGDILFNLRSALDHIAVEVAGGKRSVTFPITTFDIDQVEADGRYSHSDARRSFANFVNGIPAEAVNVIKQVQPFNAIGSDGDVTAHPLAILRRLQNFDKHRGLLLSSRALDVVGLEGRDVNVNPIAHGSIVLRSPCPGARPFTALDRVLVGEGACGMYDPELIIPGIIEYILAEVIRPLAELL